MNIRTFVTILSRNPQYDFPKMRGGGQRPFGTFPKIHQFWRRHPSLITTIVIMVKKVKIEAWWGSERGATCWRRSGQLVAPIPAHLHRLDLDLLHLHRLHLELLQQLHLCHPPERHLQSHSFPQQQAEIAWSNSEMMTNLTLVLFLLKYPKILIFFFLKRSYLFPKKLFNLFKEISFLCYDT